MKKTGLLAALLLAGLGLLVWRPWNVSPPASSSASTRPDSGESEAHSLARAPNANASRPAAPPPLSAAARDLLRRLQAALAQADRRAGEAVLSFKDDEAYRRFLARATAAGLSVMDRIDALRTVRIGFADEAALLREVAENASDYTSADGNALVQIPVPPPMPEDRPAIDQIPFGNGALAFLGATGDRTHWGSGVTIAVLDTGVGSDATFGTRVRSLDIGLGARPGEAGADGHGTAVAALAIGASADAPGVAPAANVLSIRVTDANATSDVFTVARAIVAAADAGAQVINISLGGHTAAPALDAAIGYATQRGAVIVAAAGNDQAAQLAWPAADPRVVSVGAVDAVGQQVLFSNSGEQLRLSAPGYGVQTAWLDGRRASVNGTSASAPLVAGAIAAVMSQSPQLTATQAAAVLAQTASDAGTPGADAAYGSGILNLGWAMNRNNPAYVDAAISGHAYNAATQQVEISVQNRSGRLMSGLNLSVSAGGFGTRVTVPSLGAGESYVAKVRPGSGTLQGSGDVVITSEVTPALGTSDSVPANNRRTTVLTPGVRGR